MQLIRVSLHWCPYLCCQVFEAPDAGGMYPHEVAQRRALTGPVRSRRPTNRPSSAASSRSRDRGTTTAPHDTDVMQTSLEGLCEDLSKRLLLWAHSGADASQLEVAVGALESAALSYR